jgi:hypothetical protein
MRRLVSMMIFTTLSLHAGMEALLLIPREAHPVAGWYIGGTAYAADADIASTDPSRDGTSEHLSSLAPLGGLYLGVENSYYRLGLSYDIAPATPIKIERYLMTFDFRTSAHNGICPMAGFGVGIAQSMYESDGRTLRQDNGVLALRAGARFKDGAEVLLEYNFFAGSNGNSFFEGDDFTTYTLDCNQVIMLHLGYGFSF